MTGVFNLADVLELVVDGFDEGTLAQQQFIGQGEQLVLHPLAQLGNQLQVLFSQGLEELLGEIAPVPEEFAGESFGQAGYWLTVIDVTGCHLKCP